MNASSIYFIISVGSFSLIFILLTLFRSIRDLTKYIDTLNEHLKDTEKKIALLHTYDNYNRIKLAKINHESSIDTLAVHLEQPSTKPKPPKSQIKQEWQA
jgi:uncharacterized protein YeeX (DUF496 family)